MSNMKKEPEKQRSSKGRRLSKEKHSSENRSLSKENRSTENRDLSKDRRAIIKLAVTLFLITSITAIMLAGVNALTKEPIANLKIETRNKALLAVMPNSTVLEDKTFTTETLTIFTLERPNGSYGYCVEVAPYGFGGPINMIVGIEVVMNEGRYEKRVVGVAITSMQETAGLGTKANDESFLSQYNGLFYPVQNEDGTLNISPSAITIGRSDVDVDAITGATVTSLAVNRGVNTALDAITVNAEGQVTFDGSVDGTSGATTSNSEDNSTSMYLSFSSMDDIWEVA